MTRQDLSTAAVLGVLLLAGPASAGQVSMLDSSEASAFLGTWVITLERPQGGTFDQTLAVRDEGGKVAARIDNGRGGANDITDIPKNGDDLVLTFERPGTAVAGEVVISLTADGAMINAIMTLGGGQFTVNGTVYGA